jgi:hypothetical protein
VANSLFNKGRQKFLVGGIDWDTDDIRCMLVLDTYVVDLTDEFITDLGAVDNGRSAALAGASGTDGIADATDTSLVATAATLSGKIVFFKHTGADATASLIGVVDTATGLPFTPAAGGTVNLVFDSGANKIFKL